jgi:hypothetical protein
MRPAVAILFRISQAAGRGIDAPENMQWQSVEEAKAKDKWERNDCELPLT